MEAKLKALENEAAAMHDSSGVKEMMRKLRGGKELIHVIGGDGLDTEGGGKRKKKMKGFNEAAFLFFQSLRMHAEATPSNR